MRARTQACAQRPRFRVRIIDSEKTPPRPLSVSLQKETLTVGVAAAQQSPLAASFSLCSPVWGLVHLLRTMGQLASGGRRSRPGPSRRDLVRSAPRRPVDRQPPSCCVPWAKTEENNLSHVASYQRFDSICEGPTLTPSHLPETPSPHLTTPAIRFQHMNLRQRLRPSPQQSQPSGRGRRVRAVAWAAGPRGAFPRLDASRGLSRSAFVQPCARLFRVGKTAFTHFVSMNGCHGS